VAIKLGVLHPMIKRPYHENSNVVQLTKNFLRRCEEKYTPLVPKNVTVLSMIRAESATLDALKKYRDEVIHHPTNGLVAFQKERNI
jgi:hypothetical protein